MPSTSLLGSYLEDRALVLITNRSVGKDTALDVTGVNTLKAATTPGYALMRRFDEKISKLG